MSQEIKTPEALAMPALHNYQAQSLIGEGGYGYVYQALQKSTGQQVAIKLLKFQPDADEHKRKYQAARFERETRLCAELNHPHIVKLLDKGSTVEGTPYAVFEYVSGTTLKDYIATGQGLDSLETAELMGQVLDALAAAHAKGIVHRDLKPHNIMVTRSGSRPHVKILDFGIGAFTPEFRRDDYQSLTLTREVMGTPAYAAPEQLRGEPPTTKSDLYAWGLITLECLTGEPAMKGDSVAEVFQQQLSSSNVPLPPAIAGHPLADVLRRVLERNPRKRAGDAVSLCDDFRKVNFSTLVGKIATQPSPEPLQGGVTAANSVAWWGPGSEMRQITVLCIKLNIVVLPGMETSLETLDAIQNDQLNLCQDTCVRYGGHIAGTLAGNLVVYFGYPQVSDNDARRAGRTALDLVGEVRKRNALLAVSQGIGLEIRMGMHSGLVLSKPNHTPQGIVPNLAFELLIRAPKGGILVSEATRKLLEPYLEFESAEELHLPSQAEAMQSHHVTGERQTEALSFLRPWSANRAMIGREPERQELLAFWEKSRTGKGQIVVLRGQAGIGKSKMAYELKQAVRSEGAAIREARCFPEHQNNALYPFLDMLRNHWGIAEAQDSIRSARALQKILAPLDIDLKNALPILCFWLNMPLPEGFEYPQFSPDMQKQILFDVLLRAILAIGQGKAWLLVVEDLHWLDPTGKEFLEFLLASVGEHPVQLLLTARPAFPADWQADKLTAIELQPLEKEAVGELVGGVLSGQPVADTALDYIAERADGIPLYVEELTRMLQEEGYLELAEDGRYALSPDREAKDIPMTLQDLLNARLDRLGGAKETAQLAATIGREFDYELLVRASLRDEALVQGDLDALMDADLVYRQRRVQDEGYVFRHALIRDAAYEGMATRGRKENHLRVARTLEAEFPKRVEEQPFEVGRHFAGGEDFQRAIPFGIKAAKTSLDRSADQEVLEFTNTIIKFWSPRVVEPDYNDQLNVLCLRTNSLMNRYGWASEEVKVVAFQAYELIREKGYNNFDPNNLISAHWILFTYYHVGSEREKLDSVTLEMLELANSLGDPDLKFSAKVLRGIHIYHGGNLAEGVQILGELVGDFQHLKDVKPQYTVGLENRCWAQSCYALVLYVYGNHEEAKVQIELALKRAISLEHQPTICLMYFYHGIIDLYFDDKQSGKFHAEAAIELALEYRLYAYLYYAKCILFWATDQVAELDATVAKLQEMGCNLALTCYLSAPADYEFDRGEPEKALSRIEKCLQLCEQNGEYYYQNELLKKRDRYLSALANS